jgi:hypothetical protein
MHNVPLMQVPQRLGNSLEKLLGLSLLQSVLLFGKEIVVK